MLNVIKDIKKNSTINIKGEKCLVLNKSDLKEILSIYRDKVEMHTLAKYNVKGYHNLNKEELYQQEQEFKDSLFK